MRGLLDWASTPEGIGLLSAAFGGLAGARPGQPLNSLGRAGLAGITGFSNALEAQAARETREQKGQMQTLQMQELQQRMAAAKRTEEEAQRAREEAAAKAQARGSFLGSIDPNAGPALPFSVPQAMLAGLSQQEIQALEARQKAEAAEAFRRSIPNPQAQALGSLGADASPTAANAARMQPVDPRQQLMFDAMRLGVMDPKDYLTATARDETPITVAPGAALVDRRTNKPIFTNPKAEDIPSDYRLWELSGAKARGIPFDQWDQSRRRASASNLSVNTGQRFENAYSTNQGKEFSELMGNMNKTAFAAPAQLRKLERMEALLDGVDGGKLAPTGLDIASAANTFGIKLDPKLGNKEAAQALAREIAGGFRQPGTGPMTDKDFDNFLLQVPDLSKTAQGRKQITATMKAAASRDIQIAKMAREYERKNGRIDNDFLDMAAQYIAENPVVGAPKGWKVTAP